MKIFRIVGFIFVTIIGIYIIWWNLPPEVNRCSDIRLGERLIENIENYKIENGKLPDEFDWEIFIKLKFDTSEYFMRPEYSKINDSTFELIFIDGFDPPHLFWNSNQKEWIIGFPTITHKLKNE